MSAANTANPLPGVPLIDSPFFERVAAQANWSAETLRVARELRDNGFAVLDFPDPEIDWLCDSLTAAFTPSPDKLDAWRLGKGEIRNQDAWRANPNVKRVAINSTIIRLLSTIYDRPAFAFQTLNFAVGTQQAAHSDAMHFSASPDGFMCGVWLALEDIDRDNGPLIYYPGSHRWPHYGNEHLGINAWHQPTRAAHADAYRKLWDELVAAHGAEPERFTAKKGQAIIWHARLLHGGDKQHDLMRTRHSQVTHYYFHGCSYFTPLYSDPFYGNIYFRDVTDVSTGAPVPNMVSGHQVPGWFLSQARHHGPLNAIREEVARAKRRLFG